MAVFAALRQWLFRFGPDRQTPIVLTQRRIFIVPSGTGMLFAVVLLVMLLGAINYELSLGHALVFLLAGLGLVAMVHTFRNLVGLQLTGGRPEPVFAGDVARFPITVTNTRPYARRALDLAFNGHRSVTLDVAAGDAVASASHAYIPLTTTQRGRLDPGRITLTTRYPLGLFRAWSYPHPTYACIVYPRPIDCPLPAAAAVSLSGQLHGERGQEDFAGLRLHQPNDSPRHIAWKAVARDVEHRPLLVKQFAGGAAEELWLDLAHVPDDVPLETRLSILAGWVLAADRGGARYGLRLPERALGPDQGPLHCHACLEALALHGQAD